MTSQEPWALTGPPYKWPTSPAPCLVPFSIDILDSTVSSLIYVLVTVKDVNVNKGNKVSVFNWRLPLNAFMCIVKPRDGHRRKIILLMIIVALADRIILSAEVLLAYMFYRRKFGWDDIMFGSFLAYRNVISFLGTLIILTMLKRAMRLSDEVVGSISTISYIISASGLVAARTTVSVFILPVVGIISQGSQVVQRPLLNKQILPNEQGKIYSVTSALESATQTITSPLYSLLYSKTVTTSPEAWLAPGIVLATIQFMSYLAARKLGQQTDYKVNPKMVPLKVLSKEVGVKDKNEEGRFLDKEDTQTKSDKYNEAASVDGNKEINRDKSVEIMFSTSFAARCYYGNCGLRNAPPTGRSVPLRNFRVLDGGGAVGAPGGSGIGDGGCAGGACGGQSNPTSVSGGKGPKSGG